MNGQYLCNRPITVSYAFKKEAKGERHGSAAERLLAAQNPLSHSDKPHTLFADQPQFAPAPPVPPPVNPFPMTSWLPYGALGGLPIPPGLPGLPPPPPPFAMQMPRPPMAPTPTAAAPFRPPPPPPPNRPPPPPPPMMQ